MAINPNERHKNRHTLVIGQSGSGKTHWLSRHPWLREKGARLLVWDPYESHRVPYFGRAAFARELGRAVASGKGFRLGLSVSPTPAAFEWFCRAAWTAADGRYSTFLLVEELADVAKPGKAAPAWGQLIRVGRKYGVVILAATQRPQEVEKTLFTQAQRKWVGYVSEYDQPYCEQNLGLPRGALAEIAPETYQYWYVNGPHKAKHGPKAPLKTP